MEVARAGLSNRSLPAWDASDGIQQEPLRRLLSHTPTLPSRFVAIALNDDADEERRAQLRNLCHDLLAYAHDPGLSDTASSIEEVITTVCVVVQVTDCRLEHRPDLQVMVSEEERFDRGARELRPSLVYHIRHLETVWANLKRIDGAASADGNVKAVARMKRKTARLRTRLSAFLSPTSGHEESAECIRELYRQCDATYTYAMKVVDRLALAFVMQVSPTSIATAESATADSSIAGSLDEASSIGADCVQDLATSQSDAAHISGSNNKEDPTAAHQVPAPGTIANSPSLLVGAGVWLPVLKEVESSREEAETSSAALGLLALDTEESLGSAKYMTKRPKGHEATRDRTTSGMATPNQTMSSTESLVEDTTLKVIPFPHLSLVESTRYQDEQNSNTVLLAINESSGGMTPQESVPDLEVSGMDRRPADQQATPAHKPATLYSKDQTKAFADLVTAGLQYAWGLLSGCENLEAVSMDVPRSIWLRALRLLSTNGQMLTNEPVGRMSRPALTTNESPSMRSATVQWSKSLMTDLILTGWGYLMVMTWLFSSSENERWAYLLPEILTLALYTFSIAPPALMQWPVRFEADSFQQFHHDQTSRESTTTFRLKSATIARLPQIANFYVALHMLLINVYISCRLATVTRWLLPDPIRLLDTIPSILLLMCGIETLSGWRDLLHREPPLGPQMTRIRWRCGCGEKMFDDYTELRSGALQDLQMSLDGKRSHNSPHSTPGSMLGALWRSVSRALSSSTSVAKSSLPQHNQATPSVTQGGAGAITANPTPSGPPQFLLLCVPFKSHGTKLVHLPTEAPISDVDFFRSLRVQYTSLRGGFHRLLSLRTLAEIRFVHFEVFRHDLADVRKFDAIPPDTQQGNYIYNPMPAAFVPPIGKKQLRHLYDYPEHADSQPVCFARVPRKLHARLVAAPATGSSEGWGVCFVEGFSWLSMCFLILVSVLICTVFAFAWSVLEHDIQGGFGVANYFVAVLTLGVGLGVGALQGKLGT